MSMQDKTSESIKRIQERAESHRATNIDSSAQVIQIKDAGFFGSKRAKAEDETVKVVDERIISYHSTEGKPYVNAIEHINLILTNACNLSCKYCYEQHRKDYGTWDLEKIDKIYDFLDKVSDADGTKVLQFFGGEPLIHRKLILEYLDAYEEKLTNNSNNVVVNVVTNGLLLDDKFIDAYASRTYTGVLLSLDTFKADVDHREITEKQYDRIRKAIKRIVEVGQAHGDGSSISIRCTLSRETAPTFREFVDELYELGVRDMVVHPLTMSNYEGFIHWEEDEWSKLQDDLTYAIRELGIRITFSEGVAQRGSTANCLTGNQMVAIDGSGDFSGCYFFTNLKELAHPFILGNVFTDQMYIDRYKSYHQMYEESFTLHDQCKTCDLQNYCYQCPAGNADTGSKALFRPDSMCQRIVKMYLYIRQQNNIARFNRRFQEILTSFTNEPDQISNMLTKSVQILAFRNTYKRWPPVDYVPDYSIPYQAALTMLFNGYGNVNGTIDLEDAVRQLSPDLVFPEHADKPTLDAYLLSVLHYIG